MFDRGRWSWVPVGAAAQAWTVLSAGAAGAAVVVWLTQSLRFVLTMVLTQAVVVAVVVGARRLVVRGDRIVGRVLVAVSSCLVISAGLSAASAQPALDIAANAAGFVPVVLGVGHLLLGYALWRIVIGRAHHDRKQVAATVLAAVVGAASVWAFVILPQLDRVTLTAPLVASGVLLGGDGALVAVVLRLLRAHGRRWVEALALLGLASASFAVTDATVAGPVGWHLLPVPAIAGTVAALLSAVLIAAAVLHPTARGLTVPVSRSKHYLSRTELVVDAFMLVASQIPIIFFPHELLSLRLQQLCPALAISLWISIGWERACTGRQLPRDVRSDLDSLHPVKAIQDLPPFSR